MPNLSIKDVPEEWAEALRQRALRHHRSLQGELMALVERAVVEDPGPLATADNPGGTPRARIVGYDRNGFPVVRQGWKTVEQVAAELKMKYPEPIRDQASSIELIRQDRDGR